MTDLDSFRDFKRNPTQEKRNRLVEDNLYMVDILIRRYLGKGVDYDDLYQIGAIALVSAVDRFDPDKGFEFSSFATPTILGEIKKYFRDKQWSLKVPRRIKEISAKAKKAKEYLYSVNQKMPTAKEIADFIGYSEEQVLEAMEGIQAYGTYSLDKTYDEVGADGENPFLERYTGIDENGYRGIEIKEIIDKVVAGFDPRSKYIFRERFLRNRSQSDIANDLGVSQMTVSRNEKKIVKSFRRELLRS